MWGVKIARLKLGGLKLHNKKTWGPNCNLAKTKVMLRNKPIINTNVVDLHFLRICLLNQK
jgi:hypothetical protein